MDTISIANIIRTISSMNSEQTLIILLQNQEIVLFEKTDDHKNYKDLLEYISTEHESSEHVIIDARAVKTGTIFRAVLGSIVLKERDWIIASTEEEQIGFKAFDPIDNEEHN